MPRLLLAIAMQWEWRVFFAVSDPKTSSEAHDSPNKTGLPDIWRLLHARPSSSSAAEVRTDVYVACTPRSGVKFRAGRTLEVKLRFELHDSGAERWEKVVYSYRRGDETGLDTVRTAVVDLFKQSAGLDGRSSTERSLAEQDALSLASSPDLRTLSLAKSRVQQHCQHVTVEQTDITVEEHRRAPHWRTICFEGPLDGILKVLSREVTVTSHGRCDEGDSKMLLKDYLLSCSSTGETCGYPQFVVNLV